MITIQCSWLFLGVGMIEIFCLCQLVSWYLHYSFVILPLVNHGKYNICSLYSLWLHTFHLSLSLKDGKIVVATALTASEPCKQIAHDLSLSPLHTPFVLLQRPSHLSNQFRLYPLLLNFCFFLDGTIHYLWLTEMFITALSKVGCTGKYKLPDK